LKIDTNKENVDSLYAAMDWLLLRQDKIERRLARRHLCEGSMVLYDISSSYVEGESCPLAKFGHNRDGKDGKKIIVYGLMTDDAGRPVSIQAYPGNTADSTTVPDQVEKIRGQFGLNSITLIGDRGMLTGTQIEKLKKYPGILHVSVLRGESIRQLIRDGEVSRSLLDETHLAEITSDEFPGERLVVCHNPSLEMRRQKRREELLVATEKLLTDFAQRILKRHDRGKPYSDTDIGIRFGKIADKYRVAKHFDVKIEAGQITFARKLDTIKLESELDGFYVIRTNVPSVIRCSADVVRDYKRLSDVEKSFRTIKTTMLNIRPIFHRVGALVRSHFLICMLSYYVVWHLREAWREFLFCDDNLAKTRANRNPVESAEPSGKLKIKKTSRKNIIPNTTNNTDKNTNATTIATTTNNSCEIEIRIKSFPSIMSELSKISRNQHHSKHSNQTFHTTTTPTPYQEMLLNKIRSITITPSPSPPQ
jgi:transposase